MTVTIESFRKKNDWNNYAVTNNKNEIFQLAYILTKIQCKQHKHRTDFTVVINVIMVIF